MSKFRIDEDDEFVHKAIDLLQWLYEAHDPEDGRQTESQKWEHAVYAIQLFSRLRKKLIGWAEHQVAGHVMLENSATLTAAIEEMRGTTIPQDAHELELLGRLLADYSPWEKWGPEPSEFTMSLSRVLKSKSLPINDQLIRSIISEIYDKQRITAFWEGQLESAFKQIAHGQMAHLFEPAKKGRRGQPYLRDHCQNWAVAHTYFQKGLGLGITAARREVANLLHEEMGTIRSWERKLSKHAEFVKFWEAAELTGQWGPSPLSSELEVELISRYGEYEGKRQMDRVGAYRLGMCTDYDFEPLRKLLKKARVKS